MLTLNPKQRITAEQALADPWFRKHLESKKVEGKDLSQAMESLKAFYAPFALQKAALCYIASRVLSKDEENKQRELFKSMDLNSDGKLTEAELIQSFKTMNGGNVELAKKETEKVFKSLDINKNGWIDYNGIIF